MHNGRSGAVGARPIWWVAACLALAAALVMLAWRGPVRGSNLRTNADATFILTPAEVWLSGGNPYALSEVSRAWLASGGAPELDPSLRGGAVYPPGAFVVLAPLAPWSSDTRAAAWMGVNIALYLATLALLPGLAGLSFREPSAWLMIALGAALSAAHTCLALGQTAILITAFVVAGTSAQLAGRPWLAGSLLGVAAVVKPQLAALFVLYQLIRGRWRIAGAAAAAGAALTLVGIARMHLAGVDWWTAWQANIAEFVAGGEGDPVKAGAYAFLLIHLQSPLVVMGFERDAARYIAIAGLAALWFAYLVIDRRRSDGSNERTTEMMSLSVVAAITLLIAYHRYYDATLLLFPLVMMFQLLKRGERSRAMITALVLIPLWIPGPPALAAIETRNILPAALTESLLWRAFILPHHTWMLVLLAIWLVGLRAISTSAGALSLEFQPRPKFIRRKE